MFADNWPLGAHVCRWLTIGRIWLHATGNRMPFVAGWQIGSLKLVFYPATIKPDASISQGSINVPTHEWRMRGEEEESQMLLLRGPNFLGR